MIRTGHTIEDVDVGFGDSARAKHAERGSDARAYRAEEEIMDWVVMKLSGRRAHKACVNTFNETMHCGMDRGSDCACQACGMSAAYDGPPGTGREELWALIRTRWEALTRAERARRMGEELSERPDGFGRRYSHGPSAMPFSLADSIERLREIASLLA